LVFFILYRFRTVGLFVKFLEGARINKLYVPQVIINNTGRCWKATKF